jgi:hypothetical protein
MQTHSVLLKDDEQAQKTCAAGDAASKLYVM